MNYTINDFATLVPMKYYNNEVESQKRSDMINNKNDEYIASCKKDGDWSMLIHYHEGKNLIRSRSISKVTAVYGDYTAKVPHICELMDRLPNETVLLAELCWDEPNTNANTVGTILRCLPAKAVERQKDKKLKAVIFDCLMVDGEDLTNKPYIERIKRITILCDQYIGLSNLMYPTQFLHLDEHHENYLEWADEIISEGGEGLVIQRKDNPYMPGTRTAWKTLKLKQSLPEMELKVVGVLEPNKLYEGDLIESWEYFKDGVAVTKPYYYGWKNGITVEFNNTTCDVASGLTDADREWLATPEAAEMIKNGELFAVVKAMQINDLGKLRHGYLVRLRTDLNSDGE